MIKSPNTTTPGTKSTSFKIFFGFYWLQILKQYYQSIWLSLNDKILSTVHSSGEVKDRKFVNQSIKGNVDITLNKFYINT